MNEANRFANRDILLRAPVRRFKVLDIPGWGRFRIRSISELERSRFEASIRDKHGNVSPTKLIDLKCRLIVLCVVDVDGNPLLTNSDIEQLRQQDSRYTNALVDAIQEHCGITDTDFEDLEKNCEATSGAASP